MINIPQTETTKNLIEIAIKEPVAITRKGKPVIYMLTPQALEDMIDGMLAEEAEKKGFATDEEVEELLKSIKDA
jgi:PHD/YefM family antitoxin component YafN of YafNO toxin-antitoxin module